VTVRGRATTEVDRYAALTETAPGTAGLGAATQVEVAAASISTEADPNESKKPSHHGSQNMPLSACAVGLEVGAPPAR
jgi:hypothetical protein